MHDATAATLVDSQISLPPTANHHSDSSMVVIGNFYIIVVQMVFRKIVFMLKAKPSNFTDKVCCFLYMDMRTPDLIILHRLLL
jgi:hypothetical protein